MGIEAVTYYRAVCDVEGCTCTQSDHGDEYSAYNDASDALSIAIDSEWFQSDGMLVCRCHPGFDCEECGELKLELVDDICASCRSIAKTEPSTAE